MSLISRTYNFKGNKFTVGGVGFFQLAGGDQFLPEADGWKTISPLLDDETILDMGFAKPCAEWLLAGSAHAECGKPVTQMQVSVALGKCKKVINVVGDRRWNGGVLSSPTQPQPFERMPLNFRHAYGGIDYPENPLGKGLINKKNKEKQDYELANLYLAAESIKANKKDRTPVCFAPLAVSLPQRMKYQGSYDEQWLANVHPGFPHDTDLTFFNAASLDQQFDGMISPGEAYELKGMHPKKNIIKGQLPCFSVRAFVSKTESKKDNFIEIDTDIDTVWFFPELEIGVMIYRGSIDVIDSDGLDIKTLMLAYENVDDVPRTKEHYKKMMQQRSEKKTASVHSMFEAPLKPIKSEKEKQAIQQLIELDKLAHKAKQEQRLVQLVNAKKITEQQKQQALAAFEKNIVPMPKSLVASGDYDVSKQLTELEKITNSAETDVKNKIDQAQIQIQPQPMAIESESKLYQRVFNPIFVSAVGQTPDKEESPEYLTVKSQRKARQSSPACVGGAYVRSEKNANTIRQWVLEMLANGVSLAGRDLAGADLSNIDFSHQDLTDVMFERANLSDCFFKSACLNGAVFTKANLTKAVFGGASLVNANLSGLDCSTVSFVKANLTGVNVTLSVFKNCDFSDARLDKLHAIETYFSHSKFENIQCEKAVFMQVNLTEAKFTCASVIACQFVQCNLEHSSWQGANIYRTIFLDAKASWASFSQVKANKVQLGNVGEYKNTDFSDGHWQGCGFRSLNFLSAKLTGSIFESCDFGETSFENTNVSKSVFKSCVLMLACFNKSLCQHTLFALSSLKKTHFKKTDLNESIFQCSDLSEAIFDDCTMLNIIKYPKASIK